MIHIITGLPRSSKRGLIILLDIVIVPVSLLLAFALRFGDVWSVYLENRLLIFPLALVLSLPVFAINGFYRPVIRYVDSRIYFGIAQGVSVSLLVLIAVWVLIEAPTMPRSIWIYYGIIAFLLISGSRMSARSILYQPRSHLTLGEKVAVYGAGQAGVQLVQALQQSREFCPVAFLDDNRELRGGEIFGLKVYSPGRIAKLISKENISSILLAIPSASRQRRKQIIEALEPLPVHVMVMPGMSELASGQKRIDEVREVDIEDILGRESVMPLNELLTKCVTAKTVLVTGGGGSIGSELCRQVLRLEPAKLIIMDLSEFALYKIEQKLLTMRNSLNLEVEIVGVLGSVCEQARMREVMSVLSVQTVYHAAAYKHVPLVEQNILEGVRNNILGTYYAVEAAIQANVETFVLISTDKAVRPTNVMGATKRFAELVLQGLAQQQPATHLCMVRFGNVLGSSGSVVPVFREQIQKGGPVTVTHPEIIRYFMTIPEAAQLVIQAGAEAAGGDVFVLDMGEPVKIIDLAKRMIRLHGFEIRDETNPEGDIEIKITGLRPGEKLYEELLIGEADQKTLHPMIRKASEASLANEVMLDYIKRYEQLLDKTDVQTVKTLLQEAIPEYQASATVSDHIWAARIGGDAISQGHNARSLH